MKKLSIQQLAKTIGAGPGRTIERFITGVSVDSRTIKPGDCFFAVEGDNYNGADFIAESLEKGASCAVADRGRNIAAAADRAVLKVDSPLRALGALAAQYRRTMNFKTVAITGSVGKTTTRQIIFHVLSSRFKCHQAPKNFNNRIGLPLTLLGAESDCEIVIAELASSLPGEIAYLSKITSPDIAVITNVYPAHLQGLRDIETIIGEKASIARHLQADASLIINGDFPQLVRSCRTQNSRLITFGKSEQNDIRAGNISYSDNATRFTIENTRLDLPLPGPGNLDNALAAWAVCSNFGIDSADFAEALKTLPAVSMRAEVLQIASLTVLNDCYNANPASMSNALDILDIISRGKKRRLVFVCGDMAELGKQSRLLHERLGRQIAGTNIELLIAVGRLAKTTAQAAKKAAAGRLEAVTFKNALSACNNLNEFIKERDIILVKGSRTVGLESAIEKLRKLFS